MKELNPVFRDVFSPQSLQLAWVRILKETGRENLDLFGIELFKSNLSQHLQDLSDQILSGQWHPQAPYHYEIPKSNDKFRIQTVLSIEDALVYQAIGNYLAEDFCVIQRKYSENNFGNTLHRNVKSGNAILQKPGESKAFFKPYISSYRSFKDSFIRHFRKDTFHEVVQTDLSKFYDTIPHHLLIRTLHQFGFDTEVLDLLEKCLRTYQRADASEAALCGIPTGPITSNLLAEMYLHDFDTLIHETQVPLLRYVDDMRLFGENRDLLLDLMSIFERFLEEKGLKLNSEKSKIASIDKSLSDGISQFPDVQWEEFPIGRQFPQPMSLDENYSIWHWAKDHILALLPLRTESNFASDAIVTSTHPEGPEDEDLPATLEELSSWLGHQAPSEVMTIDLDSLEPPLEDLDEIYATVTKGIYQGPPFTEDDKISMDAEMGFHFLGEIPSMVEAMLTEEQATPDLTWGDTEEEIDENPVVEPAEGLLSDRSSDIVTTELPIQTNPSDQKLTKRKFLKSYVKAHLIHRSAIGKKYPSLIGHAYYWDKWKSTSIKDDIRKYLTDDEDQNLEAYYKIEDYLKIWKDESIDPKSEEIGQVRFYVTVPGIHAGTYLQRFLNLSEKKILTKFHGKTIEEIENIFDHKQTNLETWTMIHQWRLLFTRINKESPKNTSDELINIWANCLGARLNKSQYFIYNLRLIGAPALPTMKALAQEYAHIPYVVNLLYQNMAGLEKLSPAQINETLKKALSEQNEAITLGYYSYLLPEILQNEPLKDRFIAQVAQEKSLYVKGRLAVKYLRVDPTLDRKSLQSWFTPSH